MTDKKKLVKLVLISTFTALPFFYFGKTVGFAALMVSIGFCIRSGALSKFSKKLFWMLFLAAGYLAMSFAVIPLAIIGYLLDTLSPALVAGDDSDSSIGPHYYADRVGRFDINEGTVFSPLDDDELDINRV